MVRKNNDIQIKGKKQQEGLTDSVKFMSSKFDKYEKERLEREVRIGEIESKVLCLLKLKGWNIQLAEWSNIQDVTLY